METNGIVFYDEWSYISHFINNASVTPRRSISMCIICSWTTAAQQQQQRQQRASDSEETVEHKYLHNFEGM